MQKHVQKVSQKAGLPPGAIVHVGKFRQEQVEINVLEFSADHSVEHSFHNVSDFLACGNTLNLKWISIVGVHAVDVVEQISNHFKLHPLVQEDILNTNQRPKMQVYPDYTYFTLRLFSANSTEKIEHQQISLVLGNNYVLLFLEQEASVFENLKERIRHGKGKIRFLKADYLTYALIDCIVDGYYEVLEQIGEKIELLEEKVVLDPSPKILNQIHHLKNQLLFVRRAVWPLREVINSLERGDTEMFEHETLLYLRDVYDHVIQIIDSVEMYRDIVSGLLDIYLSSVSQRLNEIMKMLTIISTIFIPLTFIAGVYGMNFKYMPELDWEWGYWGVWMVMVGISVGMLRFFRKKNWI